MSDTPEVDAEVTQEPTPEVPQEPTVGGPEIVYLSEAAKAVVFTINPLASSYIVHENGMVSEDMA